MLVVFVPSNNNAFLHCRFTLWYQYIGDITLTERDINVHELGILIFDEYAGHGNARQAINMFVNRYFEDEIGLRLEAVIRTVNPYKERI